MQGKYNKYKKHKKIKDLIRDNSSRTSLYTLKYFHSEYKCANHAGCKNGTINATVLSTDNTDALQKDQNSISLNISDHTEQNGNFHVTMKQVKNKLFYFQSGGFNWHLNKGNKDRFCSFLQAFFTYAQEENSIKLDCTSDGSKFSFTLSFDSEETTPYLTSSERNASKSLRTDLAIRSTEEDPPLIQPRIQQQNSISVDQPNCMPTLISKNWVSCDLLKVVSFIFYLFSNISLNNKSNTSSNKELRPCHVIWLIQDLTQGYLLRFILKYANVYPLNAMDNDYFVIITNNTPNLKLEIKIILQKDLLCIQCLEHTNYNDITNWTVEHENIFKDSIISNNLKNTSSDPILEDLTKTSISVKSIATLCNSTSAHNIAKFLKSFHIPVSEKKSAATSIIVTFYSKHEIRSSANAAVECKLSFQNLPELWYLPEKGCFFDQKQYFEKVSKWRNETFKTFMKVDYCNEIIFEKITLENYLHNITSPPLSKLLLKTVAQIAKYAFGNSLFPVL